MNSVERHLGVATKAATLLAMRSAKKEILLVVEGDTDISLMSRALGLPRSNMLSCNGKEILTSLFSLPPQKGIDEGTIFLRDRDCDDIVSHEKDGILLLVTDRYDIEMEFLENRIFSAIMFEYSVGEVDKALSEKIFCEICAASGVLGALRLFSSKSGANLDFDDLKYNRFFDHKEFIIKKSDLIKYVYAKSKQKIPDVTFVENELDAILEERSHKDLACSKETIEIIHILLWRKYNHNSAECSSNVISRMIRVASNSEDAKSLSLFPALQKKVASSPFAWVGTGL